MEKNREIEEALKKAREEWEKELEERIAAEREDASKTAVMSADERAKAQMEKRQKMFEEERQKYMSEKMEFEAVKELSKQKLPVSFGKLLAGSDSEITGKNIEMFKEEFLKAVEEALSERLKGKKPGVSKEETVETDPFLKGFGY